MKIFLWFVGFSLFVVLEFAHADSASRFDASLYKISVQGKNNMSELKLLAERGYADAQVKVAKACMDDHLYADALKWYSLAAKQGVLEANFQQGHMLLFGCREAAAAQVVQADPARGLSYTFIAATNGHLGASYDMATALKDGLGCSADMVAAYAWFSLCADHGSEPSHSAMNWLALRLSAVEIRQALALARETKAGRWPGIAMGSAAHHGSAVDINLKLSGVVCSPHGNLAVINKRTLAEGETIKLKSDKNELVDVTCVSVQPSFVSVKVETEADLRILTSAR
jgi:TPR repeat protein